jgi:hypothetical protein
MASSISNNFTYKGPTLSVPDLLPKGGYLSRRIEEKAQPPAPAKPVAPAAVTTAPAPVKPAATSPAPSGGGSSYKGVAIRPGSDADIAAQVRAIDAQQKGGGLVTTGAKTTATGGNATGTVTPPRATTPTTPTKGLFESVVTSLANPTTSKMTEKAQADYAKAVERLQGFKSNVADTKAAIFSDDTSARVMQGRDAAVQQANAEKLAALQGAVQEQQAAIGFGQAQQGLEQAALGAAAGFAAPSTAGYGQTVFNPLTGGFGGGSGGLDPAVTAAKLAQEVVSGRMSYQDAVSSLGYAGGAGQQFLNNALQSVPGGYNIPQGQATLAGQTAVLGSLPQMESANTAAEGIRAKIVTYLNQNPQLNPSNLAAGNTLNQWIEGKQLTDPKYQTLMNFLNEYTSTLAPVLGVGGDATNLKTEIAQSFVNAAASGQSIATVLDNLSALATGKIQDLRSGATGGGVASSPLVGGAGGFAETW